MNKITNLVLSILISLGICTSSWAQWDKNQGFYLPDLGQNYNHPNLGGGFYIPDLGGQLEAPNLDGGYYLPNLGAGFNQPKLGDGFYIPDLGAGFNQPNLGHGYYLPNIENNIGDAFYLPELGKGFNLPTVNDGYYLPDFGKNFINKDLGSGYYLPELDFGIYKGGAYLPDLGQKFNNVDLGGGFYMPQVDKKLNDLLYLPDFGKGFNVPHLGDAFYLPDFGKDKNFGFDLNAFLVPDLGKKMDIPNFDFGYLLPNIGNLIPNKGLEVGFFLPNLVSDKTDINFNLPEIGDGLYIPELGDVCDLINVGGGIILPHLGENINIPAFDNSIFFPNLGDGFNLPSIGGGYLLQELANKINIPNLSEAFYFPEIGKGFNLPEIKDGFYFPDLKNIFNGVPGQNTVFDLKDNVGGFFLPDLGKGFNLPSIGHGFFLPNFGKDFNIPKIDQGFYFPELGKGFNNFDLGAGYYLPQLGGAIDKPHFGDGFYFPEVGKAYDYKGFNDAFYFQDLGKGFGYPEIGGGFYSPDFGKNYKGFNLGGGYQFPNLAIKGYGKQAVEFPDLGEGYYFQDENGGYFFPLDEIDNQAGKRGGGFKLPNLGKGFDIPKFDAFQIPNFGGKKFDFALPQKGFDLKGFNVPKLDYDFDLPKIEGVFQLPQLNHNIQFEQIMNEQNGLPGHDLFGGINNFNFEHLFNFNDLFNVDDIFGGFDFSKFQNLLNVDQLGHGYELPYFGNDINLPQLGGGIFLPDFGDAINLPNIGEKFNIHDLTELNIPDFKDFNFPAFDFDNFNFDKFNFDLGVDKLCGDVVSVPPVVDGSGNPVIVNTHPVVANDIKFDLGFFLSDIFAATDIKFGNNNGDLELDFGQLDLDGVDGLAEAIISIKDNKGIVAYYYDCKGGCGKFNIGDIKDNYEFVNVDWEKDNKRARITRRVDTIEEAESNCNYTELSVTPQVNNVSESTALVSTSNLYTGVSLEIKESTSNEWTAISVTTNGAALLSQLKGCTKYDIRNAYSCDNGKIESDIVTFETEGCENLCDGEVTQLYKLASFGSGVVLNWDVLPGKSYRLQYKATNHVEWKTYNTNRSIALFFDLNACSTYEFKVNVICEANFLSNVSNTIAVETGNCRLGSDLLEEDALSVYPTIATNYIGIVANDVENIIDVNIYDLSGNLVKTVNPQIMSTSVSDLPSGAYIVTAIKKDAVLTARFIKQ